MTMRKDTTMTYTLNRAELREAVMDWLDKNGERVSSGAYLSNEDGTVADKAILIDEQIITDDEDAKARALNRRVAAGIEGGDEAAKYYGAAK